METVAAQALQAARATGRPDFRTTPTRVESTGLVIPPIHYDLRTGLWRLEESWRCHGPGWTLTIARGHETDLASVPWPVRGYLNAFQFGITGPLLHDFLYACGGDPPRGACVPWRSFRRPEVDRIFLSLMEQERVPAWRRTLGYAAVRIGGAGHWEAHGGH
jgi:hypothetical protein